MSKVAIAETQDHVVVQDNGFLNCKILSPTYYAVARCDNYSEFKSKNKNETVDWAKQQSNRR